MVLRHRRQMGRAAFTLVELLVVIGIMAVLATISVAGYSAASRGMANRGAYQSVSTVLRIAKQSCEIDRVPTTVFFFNRRFSSDVKDEDATLYQGTAIAAKQVGRITIPDSEKVIDEFADWHQSSEMLEEGILNQIKSQSKRIFRMRNKDLGENVDTCSMEVKPFAASYKVQDFMIQSDKTIEQWSSEHKLANNCKVWGLKASEDNKGLSASAWEVGDPYGEEIAHVDLPKGYVFGKSLPNDDILKSASVTAVSFYPDPGSLEAKTSGVNVPVCMVRRLGSTYTAEEVVTITAKMLNEDYEN